MKRCVVFAILGWAALGTESAPQGKTAGAKGWHASLDTANALARKTGKPLMVVFRCEP
jgi:hypothetical protein